MISYLLIQYYIFFIINIYNLYCFFFLNATKKHFKSLACIVRNIWNTLISCTKTNIVDKNYAIFLWFTCWNEFDWVSLKQDIDNIRHCGGHLRNIDFRSYLVQATYKKQLHEHHLVDIFAVKKWLRRNICKR